MGRRRGKSDHSSSASEGSDSRDVLVNDFVDDETAKLYTRLIEQERELCAEEARMAMENNRTECLVRSHFAVKTKRLPRYTTSDTSIENDIKIITKML